MVKIENLTFGYTKEVIVLNNINFKLEKGDLLTIIGANGSGKSTLFNCISGLLNYKKGKIYLSDEDIKKKSRKWISQKMALVNQIDDIHHNFYVRDYLLMGRNPYIGFGKTPSKRDYDLVDQVMDQFNIDNLADRYFNNLSGGQKQKVKIARSIVQDTELILLDEPTNHLDIGNQYEIVKIIKSLKKESKTIILTTHSPDIIEALGGKVGIVSEDGTFKIGEYKDMISERTFYEIYKVPVKKYFSQDLRDSVLAIDWENSND